MVFLYHNYFRGNEVTTATPKLNKNEVQIDATPVKVQKAFMGELVKYVHATGFAEPIRQATITSRVNGRIATMPVLEGQRVRKGELLLQIDDELLQIELVEGAQISHSPDTFRGVAGGNYCRKKRIKSSRNAVCPGPF